MVESMPMPKWRNFAAWSAAGAIFYTLTVWSFSALLHKDSMSAIFRSTQVVALLGLALIASTAVTGFSNRKRPISPRTVRNFVIQNAVAAIACLFVIWGFSALARGGGVGVSEWAAAVTGATLILIACVGTLAVASAHTSASFVDDEAAREDMRERGRLFLCSFAWTAACGLWLLLLALAGPGGPVSPTAALAGALALIAVLTALGIAAWRLSDELGRTLSYETGNMAFYMVLVLGGGWAMLAHLGFVIRLAPLDWLNLFVVLLFAASFIVVGRRKLLTR